MNVTVIVPALNEAGCISDLVGAIQAQAIQEVVVVDNGSSDDTAGMARRAGARIPRRSCATFFSLTNSSAGCAPKEPVERMAARSRSMRSIPD